MPQIGLSRQREQDPATLKEAATIPLLARIAHGEVDDQIMKKRGFASEYDVPYNYTKTDKPLSQMTINEVKALQDQLFKKFGVTVVGKYQMGKQTLIDAQKGLRLGEDAVFDAAQQERMARWLLARRIRQSLVDGRLDPVEFQKRLHKEWSSVAPDGEVDQDKYGTTSDQIQEAMDPLLRVLAAPH
jgi:hypothetical protein